MGNNILIVDDEVLLTQLLGDYFRTVKEYSVFIANDGKTAVDVIKERLPMLVLLDMKLPSVNGLEILKILRKDYPATKVIVMTAYDAEFKKEIDLIGYDAFFIKPIAFEELRDTVDDLLSGKPLKSDEHAYHPVSHSQKEVKQALPVSVDVIPQARIAVIEPKESFGKLLKDYFETLEDVKFNITIFSSGDFYFDKITVFSPDIVLYDIVEINDFSEIAAKLLNMANPPKEIVLFGDPQFKWEDVEALIKKGMNYISTPLAPLDPVSKKHHEFDLPNKEAIDKLTRIISQVCLKHGLAVKKGENI